MVALFHRAPTPLIAGALLGSVLMLLVSATLFWHWIRRRLNITYVPRVREVYVALGIAWGALATCCVSMLMAVMLLRDHSRIDARTELAEVRCEPAGPGRVRAEVTFAGAAPESYDIEGSACVLSVTELEMRTALQALGMGTLARVDKVGSSPRVMINPVWLAPNASTVSGLLLALAVRYSRVIPVTLPADAQHRFVLVAAPGRDPVLEPART
jgi:hypothetical protein